jgi:hypothetical protein
MSTKPRTIEETHCDRCERRIAKHRDPVALTPTGVTDTPDDIPLELCSPCETSLRKWWARGKKGEA